MNMGLAARRLGPLWSGSQTLLRRFGKAAVRPAIQRRRVMLCRTHFAAAPRRPLLQVEILRSRLMSEAQGRSVLAAS